MGHGAAMDNSRGCRRSTCRGCNFDHKSEREIARKRAAIDFFLKTDLDSNMLEAHADFEAALKKLKKHTAEDGSISGFADGAETEHRVTNVHQ